MPWAPTACVSVWPFSGATTARPTSMFMSSLAAHWSVAKVLVAGHWP
ncbi:hypothetical protein [Streptomyces xanthophaeus]